MERTVVALFDNVNTAQQALEDLLKNGFDRSDVSVMRADKNATGTTTGTTSTEPDNASGTAAGAGIGAALGGIAGLVIGLGVIAIPGIGPIIAAGPLATTLAGAGIGAAAGGIIGALTDVGIPEQEAGYYAEGVRRGGTLLTVHAGDDQVGRATGILTRYSPVDINQRAEQWRSSGWTGYDASAGAYDAPTTGTGREHAGMSSMGSTGQYAGASGAGMGYSRFDDYDDYFRSDWETRYRNSGYGYQRYQPAYRYGWDLGNRYQGRDWNDIQPEVQTDWERIHPNDKWEDFKDSIRTGWERFKQGASDKAQDVKQGVTGTALDTRQGAYDTERTYDRTTSRMSRTFDTYDPYFRSDWEQSYRSSGYGYERYQPAYQYGYTLATENRYRGQDWNAIEPDARRDWEMRHPGDRWEDFKDAVQRAWDRVRSDVKDAVD